MMSSPFALLLALSSIAPSVVRAQSRYTVHGSVVFTLNGESAPYWGNVKTRPKDLTSLGAQQLYAAGQYFRARYLPSTGSTVNGTMEAPILGLSPYRIDGDQTYVAAADNQNTVASAQAFVQGLYPPVSVSSRVPAGLSADSILANNSYIENPLAGYQYAQIHTASALSPTSVYVAGDVNCPKQALSAIQYVKSQEFAEKVNSTAGIYTALGLAVTSNALDAEEILNEGTWGYANAYQIYDYLTYLYAHNATVRSILDSPAHSEEYAQIRWLANEFQYAMLGNTTRNNGIQAIAGKTLAYRILTLLNSNIAAQGSKFKVSLLFGDIAPFISFFALSSLPQTYQSDFYGLPLPGSSMVFELFSVTQNSSDAHYPLLNDLWVRFLFRNGTTYSTTGGLHDPGDLQAYPIFHRGPDQPQMPWVDFANAMEAIAVGGPGEWCEACGGNAIFCPMYNASYSLNIDYGSRGNEEDRDGDGRGLSAQVAGVLGFAVTFAFFVILMLLGVLLGGVRFHRVPSRRASAAVRFKGGRGFKGGQKMASDADLNLPKNGAVVGVSFGGNGNEESGLGKNERVGSWEMKGKDIADGRTRSRRESLDEDIVGINPFREPVKADERV